MQCIGGSNLSTTLLHCMGVQLSAYSMLLIVVLGKAVPCAGWVLVQEHCGKQAGKKRTCCLVAVWSKVLMLSGFTSGCCFPEACPCRGHGCCDSTCTPQPVCTGNHYSLPQACDVQVPEKEDTRSDDHCSPCQSLHMFCKIFEASSCQVLGEL